MARYIDAHRVENLLTMCGNYHGVIWLESVESILHDVPTADVVEVVRCKDCKCDDSNPQHLPCTGWYPPDDFFCAYGERSEDGHNTNDNTGN